MVPGSGRTAGNPWDPAYRTAGPQYPGTTMCSAFRTFQGWTALSDMAHDQGVLQAFHTGSSPSDFPAERYERTWTNRFQPHDLNDTGRRGLGLPSRRRPDRDG